MKKLFLWVEFPQKNCQDIVLNIGANLTIFLFTAKLYNNFHEPEGKFVNLQKFKNLTEKIKPQKHDPVA